MMRLERCEPCDIPSAAEQAAEARSHGACEECGQSPCACFAPVLCACGAPAVIVDSAPDAPSFLCEACFIAAPERDLFAEEPCAPDDPAFVAIMAEVQR